MDPQFVIFCFLLVIISASIIEYFRMYYKKQYKDEYDKKIIFFLNDIEKDKLPEINNYREKTFILKQLKSNFILRDRDIMAYSINDLNEIKNKMIRDSLYKVAENIPYEVNVLRSIFNENLTYEITAFILEKKISKHQNLTKSI